MQPEIARLTDTRCRLGEGPLWDAREGALFWVDSLGPYLFRLDWASGALRHWLLPAEVGSLALREKGGAILSLPDGFHAFSFATGRARPLALLEADLPENRFNDGKTDRQGRFLAGSMHRTDRTKATGALYRLDPDGRTEQLEAGVIVSNGPCFSPDGRTFYFADSPTRRISAYDYDPASGAIANKRLFCDLAELDSMPDGATVDAEGCLWTALVRSGEVARFDPAGKLERRVAVPAPRPSSVAFAGPDLDVLIVTSIRDSGTWQAPMDDRESGRVFAIRGLGVKGLPEARFRG